MDLLYEGLQITVIGMGVVFFVLFLLSVILRLFKSFFSQKEPEVKVSLPGDSKNTEEVVLTICAVMAGILDDKEYICNIRQLN